MSDFLFVIGDVIGVKLKIGFDVCFDEWLVYGIVVNRMGNFDLLL